MGKLRALGRMLASWYIAGPVLAIVGLAIGYAVFFNVFPGKPQIGVIDIPFTGLSEDSAAIITAYLNYCRRNPDIKGVVIKLASPGGGASPSEQLYIETRRLREEKPVVLVMGGVVGQRRLYDGDGRQSYLRQDLFSYRQHWRSRRLRPQFYPLHFQKG